MYQTVDGMEPWKEVFSNEKTAQSYAMLDKTKPIGFAKKSLLEPLEKSKMGSERGLSDQELEMKILTGDKTAYIKIPTFDGNRMEEEGPRIAEFIANAGYTQDLIIDIRGNGGGNSNYWYKYIVAPNITEDKSVFFRYLVTQEVLENEETKKFLKNQMPATQKDALPIAELPDYPNLSPFAKNFDFYFEQHGVYSAETCDKPYKGNIWILQDKGNGSAAQGFLHFANQTGFAKTVGSQSNGNGPMTDPNLFTLTNSRLIVRLDPYYPLNSDGSCGALRGEKPDYSCNSQDALMKCLELIDASRR